MGGMSFRGGMGGVAHIAPAGHIGRHANRHAARLRLARPFIGSGFYGYDSCIVARRVHAPAGWIVQRVNVCYDGYYY